MLITALEPRRKSLCAVFIDGEFAMNLDMETILSARIDVGCELSDEELKELIDRSNEKRAKEKALWLISYRDHSKKELIDKIKRTADADSAQKAADRLEELGLISDENFARRYARELIQTKHLSVSGAKYKLQQKGIDKELVQSVLDDLAPDPREHIRAVIEKKYSKNINDEKGLRRCINGLQRLGYRYTDIKAVLSEYTEDESYEL